MLDLENDEYLNAESDQMSFQVHIILIPKCDTKYSRKMTTSFVGLLTGSVSIIFKCRYRFKQRQSDCDFRVRCSVHVYAIVFVYLRKNVFRGHRVA